jgi:two-component system, NtrC family, response regulator HydG
MNVLLLQLQAARNETKLRQNKVFDEMQRQPVCLDSMAGATTLEKYQEDRMPSGIVGAGQAMRELNAMIHKAAQVMADVLIVGETGTGKELTAEAIHRGSARANGPFISINCGALDENLLMDALFGHVKGAFSEAKADRKGAFWPPSGGTLHLDEIGNASPKVQQAMLRALAARVIRPLGSDQEYCPSTHGSSPRPTSTCSNAHATGLSRRPLLPAGGRHHHHPAACATARRTSPPWCAHSRGRGPEQQARTRPT